MSSKLKFLFISIVFILFLLLFNNNNSYAATNEDYYNSAKSIAGDNSFCIYYANDGTVKMAHARSVNFKYITYNTSNGGIFFKKTSYSSGSLGSSEVYTWNGTTFTGSTYNGITDNKNNFGYNGELFIYSSIDIYGDAGEGLIFFQPPPPIIPEEVTTIIPKKVEEIQMMEVLTEIIQIIPLIIVILVSFLGLRKALSVLLTLLRRCLII